LATTGIPAMAKQGGGQMGADSPGQGWKSIVKK